MIRPFVLILSTQDFVPDGWTLSVSPCPSDTEKRFSRGRSAAIFLLERFPMNFKILQKFDDAGYYAGQCTFQVLEGVFAPENTTETGRAEDADNDANFYKWNGEAWQEEKKPTCAADLLGVVVSHKSQTAHDQEMRALVQKLGTEEGYRINRGDDLEWIVEKIPQEEIDAQAIDAELSDFDQQIASLKDRLATATLQDDAETVAALKAEYKTLMGA